MTSRQKWIFAGLLLMAAAAFALFIPANAASSVNLSMVQMFQPDEAVVLPYIFHMIAPAASLNQALRAFIFYDYYFYGFPFFGLSAALLIPLHWFGQSGNLPLIMAILRQMVSVLPMLAALLLLVYMQDEFRSYRSLLLFAFLLLVPAVVQNNLWWHPDGLTFLFVVLTLFFLKRDNLRLGWNFILAAIMCGVATAIKLMGVYFFLAVGLTLGLAVWKRRVGWKRLIGMALAFLGVMGLAYLIANPFLLSHWARTAYLNIFHKQTALLEEGYGVIYAKGPAAAWPLMHASFGELIFLLVALAAAIWGAWRGPQRLLHGLILAWFVPVTVVVLWVSHFKFQYWMPVALPLFSSLAVFLPERWKFWAGAGGKTGSRRWAGAFARGAALLILLVQTGLFLTGDIQSYHANLHQADHNDRIAFYTQAQTALAPLAGQPIHVYYDYRLYVPDTPGWTSETTTDLLDYNTIRQHNYDVLLLLEQRIRDYTNPEVQGVDPAQFALNQKFYLDAESGTIAGYHLVYSNAVGRIFVSEPLYQEYFQK